MIFFYRKKFVSVYGIEIGSILNSLVGYQPYSKVMCRFNKYKWPLLVVGQNVNKTPIAVERSNIQKWEF